jgi:hypothetical protein
MQKLITTLAAIALDATLFCIGIFFVYWGTWNYLFGSPIPGMGLGVLMIVLGATLMLLGLLVVIKLLGYLSLLKHGARKRVTPLKSVITMNSCSKKRQGGLAYQDDLVLDCAL